MTRVPQLPLGGGAVADPAFAPDFPSTYEVTLIVGDGNLEDTEAIARGAAILSPHGGSQSAEVVGTPPHATRLPRVRCLGSEMSHSLSAHRMCIFLRTVFHV